MRHTHLINLLFRSYLTLKLRTYRIVIVITLMVLSAILEMIGLSMLYPVVLALGSGDETLDKFFSYIPILESYSWDTKSQITIMFAGMGLIYIVKNLSLYYSYRYNIGFAMYYYQNLVNGLYKAYINRSVIEFKKESSGELANMVCVQPERIVHGTVRPLLVFVTESLVLCGIASLVFWINPILMGMLIITCGTTAGFYYFRWNAKAIDWGNERMKASSTLHDLVNNTSFGINEIKIFGSEGYLSKKVYSTAGIEKDMFRRLELYQIIPRYILESVFVLTIVLFVPIFLIFGSTDLPVLLAQLSVIAAASLRLLPSITRLVNSYSNFSFNTGPGLALMETISESSTLSSKSPSDNGPNDMPFTTQTIQLSDVGFSYQEAQNPVFANVNANISQGQRVGIVGPSGSGKSTLIDILAGLYDPTQGTVTVDGHSVIDNVKSWQSHIGYVPQAPFIIPGSIKDNITFGDGISVTTEELLEVIDKVGLASLIQSLPEGMESLVGERGIGLSGGQKQLLCLARALVRRPGVLLLDEPTAALDSTSEEIVLAAINNLPQTVTIVMVSHKLSNLRTFDMIYTCKNGAIIPMENRDTG